MHPILERLRALSEESEDSMIVQSILFDKDKFSESEAKAWLESHDYSHGKVDETEENLRFRQKEPEAFEDGSFRTVELSTGIKAVMGKLS